MGGTKKRMVTKRVWGTKCDEIPKIDLGIAGNNHVGRERVDLATIVEGDPKAPFSIATTPRCREGRYSIPRIAPLYPWTVPYNAEC